MTVIGSRIQRAEDVKFLTRGGTYTDDVVAPRAAWVTFVRSTVPHARLLGVDVSEALDAPGVVAIYTGADVDLPITVPVEMPGRQPENYPRPWLATDVVRFVGEPIAAIITENKAQGEDAVERVVVDYELLDAVVDVDASMRDEVVLHPAVGTNVCFRIDDDEVDVSDCEVVVRARVINNKVAPCSMEPQAAMAEWTPEGRIVLTGTSQGPHVIKNALVRVYQLDPSMVRVVSPDVGGAFGGKAFPAPEAIFLPWLARACGRTVRWTETRSESMLNLGHGRGQVHDVVIGGSRDGHLRAYDLTVIQDAGAYPRVAAMIPGLTRMMHTGTYATTTTKCRVRSVLTNTVPLMAYRGAGRPEAAATIERAIDLFAAEIGMDPLEVRRKNLVPADVFPYTTTAGTVYDSGDYRKALDLVVDAVDYTALRAEQAALRAAGDRVQLGIGLACYVEITGGNGGTEYGRVEITPTGGARVYSGAFSHGQGHATTWAMIVSHHTGIALDRIELVAGDTDLVPEGGLTGGSRSVQIAGSNISRATETVVEKAREHAAARLEANVDDIVVDTDRGCLHVAGSPSLTVSWADVFDTAVAAADPLDAIGGLSVGGSFPSGAHAAVVEVDTETGQVRVRRFVAADDAGRIINPLLAEGQIHGGLAQGIAQALLEEVVYAEDGTPLTTNFADYPVISAAELPSFETIHVETISPRNPLGAKGIGESGSIGSTPAIQNAVVDALSHLGVRHIDMPLRPEKILRSIGVL